MDYIQQGDVLIFKVDEIPQGAKRLDHLILAEGEATGHAHRIVSGDAVLFAAETSLYLKVTSEKALLTHEEHGEQNIERGLYRIGGVREMDYDEMEARRVQD